MTHFPPIQSGTIEPSILEKNSILNLYSSWPDETLDKLNLSRVLLKGSSPKNFKFTEESLDFY